ncbi:MAG: Transcriptional regulator, PaaX family [Candidatus Roizmanbacteria bacterium GW2011_GWB1_40_7]|uniref:Transcriptional regulator, PaaX family n=1 Tax=Candidatus Roizmanbacteria bacterium GW2011_GWB1_40_7 TaxID=1618482 RepID=A0A0G0W6Z2_9BACT|nr:MAG: Transcriptional regulator, PaaX family [Candidatus Roizmanbacteria bacterium GW2011_GWB1_40_7]OGH51502.1 MAG: CRISPR-associated endonuclease Cas2 [Candidatus Levybacteria bacterium RIFCSPLOWO2_12_FULL_37_14]
MKKLLRPRDILLLGLTNALDAFEELKDPLHLVSKSYDQMYGWVPDQYKKHHFNHLVWRSLRAGYIEKIEKDGEIYIRITSSGAKMIQRDFPLLSLQNKTWDHKWRIVMFDIAEIQKKKRDYLREKLKELGFGMLQESVFITPHDILRDFLEYAESIGLRDSVDILEASYILGEKKQLANRVWRLEDLSKKYLEIIQEIEELLEAAKVKNSHLIIISGRTKQLNNKVREIKERYAKILLSDPFLPKELLPKNYSRDQAGRLINKYLRNLNEEKIKTIHRANYCNKV